MDAKAKAEILGKLQLQRAAITAKDGLYAELFARHGAIFRGAAAGGTWIIERDALKERVKYLDQPAEYDKFLERSNRERAALLELEYTVRAINEQIRALLGGVEPGDE